MVILSNLCDRRFFHVVSCHCSYTNQQCLNATHHNTTSIHFNDHLTGVLWLASFLSTKFLSLLVLKAVRCPRGVCGRGAGSNSIQCTSCQKWVNNKCSGIKGSMSKVMKSFICRGCLNPVTSSGRTSIDTDPSANLELVDKFGCLGVMLSVDGDADAAVEARI